MAKRCCTAVDAAEADAARGSLMLPGGTVIHHIEQMEWQRQRRQRKRLHREQEDEDIGLY